MTFTAPDGATFEDRQEWKAYMMRVYYTFEGQSDVELKKVGGEIEGQPFELRQLSDCNVLLLDHSETVQADELVGCQVFIAASSSSVFIRDCSNCTFTVACRQLRTRDCHNCRIYLYCATDPIIELSDGIEIAPFNGAYPDLPQHMASAGLDPSENSAWVRVYDFNDAQNKWDRNSEQHWRHISQEEDGGIWAPEGNGGCPVDRDAAWALVPQGQFAVDSVQSETLGDVYDYDLPAAPEALADAAAFTAAPIPAAMAPAAPAVTDWGSAVDATVAMPAGESSAMAQLQAAFEDAVRQRQSDEEEARRAAQSKAEEDLDNFYDARTDNLAHRQGVNREKEEAMLRDIDEAQASSNPWVKVCELIDLKAPPPEEEFVSIDKMRSLLIQVKADYEHSSSSALA